MTAGDRETVTETSRGLAPAREGGGHWIGERVTSVALLLLGTWLIASLLFLPSLDQRTLAEWLARPSGAVPMALFVITAFIHGLDGLNVAVDDYVHDEGNRFALNTLLLFAAIGGVALALFALARIAFGGAA